MVTSSFGPDEKFIWELKLLYMQDSRVKKVVDAFSDLQPYETVITVSELVRSVPLDRTEIIDTLRDLARKTYLGSFVVGRRGSPSRFSSRYRLKGIFEAATERHNSDAPGTHRNDGNELDESSPALPDDSPVFPPADPSGVEALDEVSISDAERRLQEDLKVQPSIEHRFQLRPDLAVVVKLPVDLSQSEAARLSAFIQTLPFH